jgi:phosphotransferase system  glucose/maltose/N-acetylglucosamine-specific IIC component
MTYEFNTKKEKSQGIRKWMIVVLISIAIFIIGSFLFFIIWRKMRIKNRSLENKVSAISFSTGLNQDLIINRDSDHSKNNEEYENTFI